MDKAVFCLLMMGFVAGAGLGAPGPGEKTVQFSLGGSVMAMTARYEEDPYFLFGAALRVDFNIGRWLGVAPEISVGIGGYSGGMTINARPGKFFIGAGYLAAGGFEDEWGLQSLVKVHAGYKSPRAILAAAFLANRWFKGCGLTVGYVF
jgi:hypothetical protein